MIAVRPVDPRRLADLEHAELGRDQAFRRLFHAVAAAADPSVPLTENVQATLEEAAAAREAWLRALDDLQRDLS